MSLDPVYLLDILIAARLVQDYVQGIDRPTFNADKMLQDAIMWHVHIICEAARRLSEEFRAAHPEIPWQQVIGMLNVLIHNDDQIKFDTLWKVAQHDIPELIELITPLVPPDETDS